jgi:hypothetical protein
MRVTVWGVTEGMAESINTSRTRFEDWKDSALMTWLRGRIILKMTLR